ncbi:hypothetical protein [Ruegeria meonggei]|uniref:hypothetical protein n=1 Tax=Ruegeria meonggei TaxID=1446476 RepID=UPI00117AB94B|nr:hypothetical protein [Ruegeria meonggei]
MTDIVKPTFQKLNATLWMLPLFYVWIKLLGQAATAGQCSQFRTHIGRRLADGHVVRDLLVRRALHFALAADGCKAGCVRKKSGGQWMSLMGRWL